MIGARCCDIAPAICWPDLRVAALLPTPMLPLPTTAILHWMVNWDNAEPTRKVARCSTGSAQPMLRFMAGPSFASRFFSRERLKTRGVASNLGALTGVSPANGDWRDRMRALSYIIAFAFVLGGPSLAGSADRDVPGVGT